VKKVKVSNNVIRRMPRYLRMLDELMENGVNRISSFQLGQLLGLTPSQIRQDFSCFGEFGQQGYGYNVVGLRSEIAKILGMDRNYSAVLVGVGNIGHALIENFCFEQYGFTLRGAFDINPDLIGKELHGTVIKNADDFGSLLLNYGKVAVVPGTSFGAPTFIRWSYATSIENIKEGLNRLERFLKGEVI